jgi:hypothetical protein
LIGEYPSTNTEGNSQETTTACTSSLDTDNGDINYGNIIKFKFWYQNWHCNVGPQQFFYNPSKFILSAMYVKLQLARLHNYKLQLKITCSILFYN